MKYLVAVILLVISVIIILTEIYVKSETPHVKTSSYSKAAIIFITSAILVLIS